MEYAHARTRSLCNLSAGLLLIGLISSPTLAQFNSGSDGSDGAFNPTGSVSIDLSQATTATWDTPSPQPGKGVYDAAKWAVVFKYSTINIPAGVTVTFKNHPSRAPVVWLATGNVSITGTVDLSGKVNSTDGGPLIPEPGPGGFRGGKAGYGLDPLTFPGGGMGPGGANFIVPLNGNQMLGNAGSYAIPQCTPQANSNPGSLGLIYGTEIIMPLVGGSGSAGTWNRTGLGGDGGGGGGAVLIASSGKITLGNCSSISYSGVIQALGGSGNYSIPGGSGGAIRIVANEVCGKSALNSRVYGAICGLGRIRIEAYNDTLILQGDPTPSRGLPNPVFPPSTTPSLRATVVKDQPVSTDPIAGMGAGGSPDVIISDTQPVTIEIAASNVPPGNTVSVRVVPKHGVTFTVTSTPLTGTLESSTATAQATFPRGFCAVQLRANWTPTP